MQVEALAHEFSLTAALRDYVERRIRFALGRYRDTVRAVQVRLRDVNGPRGGADKLCLLQVELAGQRPLVIRDSDTDLYRAISRAARRADQQVARRLSRRERQPR